MYKLNFNEIQISSTGTKVQCVSHDPRGTTTSHNLCQSGVLQCWHWLGAWEFVRRHVATLTKAPQCHPAIRSHHKVCYAAIVEGYSEPGLWWKLQGSAKHHQRSVTLHLHFLINRNLLLPLHSHHNIIKHYFTLVANFGFLHQKCIAIVK